MKYLSKFLLALALFGITCTVISKENTTTEVTNYNNELLFGRNFKQEKSIGSNKYFEHSSVDELIRLKKIKYKSNSFARIYIKDRMALFHSVFDIKRVDYPGQYSKTITCPDEFKPKLYETEYVNGFFTFYAGFANKNKITGACVADLIEYKYSYGFIFCSESGSLIEFEHYSALNSNFFEYFRGNLICN
jgi:hypothetical protein